MGGRTTLIIAHRLSSLNNANRVVVLEDGCITAEGSHQDLLAQEGLYRRLHDLQVVQ
jgi:ABC-type multidrug transport system fused ATPase/permease subunit